MITSNKNAKVKYVVRLQAERRFRWRERAFVVEGTRWLSELAAEGHPLKLVFCTEDWRSSDNHEAILQQVDAPVQTVSPEVMVEISDTETAPGVLSVADMVLRPFPSTPRWYWFWMALPIRATWEPCCVPPPPPGWMACC